MGDLHSWKRVFLVITILCVVGLMYWGYFYCARWSCSFPGLTTTPAFPTNFEAYLAGRYLQNQFSEKDLNTDYKIDRENGDVLVFLHIQKTGGTKFGAHLVRNVDVDPPCCRAGRCMCLNKKKQVWLFSSSTIGWGQFGLHGDWTELHITADRWFQEHYGEGKRKFYYMTFLRDPVPRFISEWLNTKRGGTWKDSHLLCNGKAPAKYTALYCYRGRHWTGVSLQQFINCPHNLAFNRQTRMLANLSLVHCYNTTAMAPARRNALLLESAKRNLLDMAFFGLTDFQVFSQFLLEHILHLKLIRYTEQDNRTKTSQVDVPAGYLRRIAELNHLDVELYQFAKDLFLQRVQHAYTQEGRPLPQQLQRVMAQQASRQPRGTVGTGWGVFTDSSEKN